MSKLRDAAQQALEALESAIPWIVTDRNTFAEVVRARHFQRNDTETDEVILSGYDAVIDDAEKAITALRTALAEPAEQEAVEIEMPEYHSHGMGCGLEDRGITDRYEAMEYGWYEAIDRVKEELANFGPLYTAPQPTKQPLIDDEICDSWELTTGHQIQFGPSSEGRPMYWSTDEVIEFARAIERAHSIGEHE